MRQRGHVKQCASALWAERRLGQQKKINPIGKILAPQANPATAKLITGHWPRKPASTLWAMRTFRETGTKRVAEKGQFISFTRRESLRLGVSSPLLGFQGCRAARHDDHIHIQIKR
jgi:hypothetical protein